MELRKFKAVIFDLDGTLSEIGKGMNPEDIALLKKLEASGIRIVICSGKTTFYLCGYVRQIGLEKPILIGENGAMIQFGIDLPPKEYYRLPYDQRADRSIKLIREYLKANYPDIWYQPNETVLTFFPENEIEFTEIGTYLEEYGQELQGVDIYRHADCFDIVPCGINKKNGLIRLSEILSLTPEDFVAVGDGINDYPMFEAAGYAMGIRVSDPSVVDVNYANITQALQDLNKL